MPTHAQSYNPTIPSSYPLFPPIHQGLGVLKSKFPSVPLMALTATATHAVQADVVSALCLKQCVVFKQTFNRPNLR
ncbi:unnamed protein product [Closterium sp. NIES-54]